MFAYDTDTSKISNDHPDDLNLPFLLTPSERGYKCSSPKLTHSSSTPLARAFSDADLALD